MFGRFLMDENGQGMVEYVLIIALVAILLVFALGTVEDALTKRYGAISNVIQDA